MSAQNSTFKGTRDGHNGLVYTWLNIDRAAHTERSEEDEEVPLEENFREDSNLLGGPTEGASN
jgi:hypothetical protein